MKQPKFGSYFYKFCVPNPDRTVPILITQSLVGFLGNANPTQPFLPKQNPFRCIPEKAKTINAGHTASNLGHPLSPFILHINS